MDLLKIVEKVTDKPLEFAALIAVITIFVYVASIIAKHPIQHVIGLIEQIIKEFRPTSRRNKIEVINVSLVFFLFIITIILLVGMLSSSIVSFFVGNSAPTDRWLMCSFLLSLFLLVFSGWFSPNLIIRSREQKQLLNEIRMHANKGNSADAKKPRG